MNICPHCEAKFYNWVEYNEHLAFSHWKTQDMSQSPFEEEKPIESQEKAIKTYSSGRSDLYKRPWLGYMPKEQHDAIVNKWESKQSKGVIIK